MKPIEVFEIVEKHMLFGYLIFHYRQKSKNNR